MAVHLYRRHRFHNYRRLVIRWERHADNFLAVLHLASALIL